ncbi:MAG: hypothetical protein ABIB43_00185 [archaeon]
MAVEDFIEQTYNIKCKGRDKEGKEVLDKAIKVDLNIWKRPGSSDISSSVNCPYNIGGHRDRCNASHPDSFKLDVGCPYSFDIPYALEKNKDD